MKEDKQFKERSIELYKLGFEKNDDQQCFGAYKYGILWTIDFWNVLDFGDKYWEVYLDELKSDLKTAEKNQFEETINSYEYYFAQKEFKKKLMDKFNGLNSVYKELSKPKLSRKSMTEYGLKLEGKVELLKELLNNG